MKIETKYNIGDTVYTIDNCTNNEWDEAEYKREDFHSGKYISKFAARAIIKETVIEGFIVDNNEEVHPAIDGWDGWNKVVQYNSINGKCYNNLQIALAELRA